MKVLPGERREYTVQCHGEMDKGTLIIERLDYRREDTGSTDIVGKKEK